MQKYAEYFFLEIAPHPSDGSDFLQHLWKTHRGRLRGAVLAPGTGRIAALSSDGVVGMASILLYEENTVPPLAGKLVFFAIKPLNLFIRSLFADLFWEKQVFL